MSKEKVLENNNTELTDEEIAEWLGKEEDTFIDPRFNTAKKARALIGFWYEFSNALARTKEGYHLAQRWEDENLQKKYIEEGKPLIKKIKTVEEELKEILPQLEKTSFLHPNEVAGLPSWMISLLGFEVNT